MKKTRKIILFGSLAIFLLIFGYFFVGFTKPSEKIIWGVNFSQKHAENLGLDWKEAYSALLDDAAARNFKIAAQWDLIEPEENEYNFDDLDWQIKETGVRGAEILLVLGMKTPRWPECHIPDWARGLDKKEQQERILKLIEKTVLRYEDSAAIKYWQVENEPFFRFGECPWSDEDFFKKEMELVKSLDSSGRPVLISDSGEFSLWIKAAGLGDIVGTTMYRKAWFHEFNSYFRHIFPPVFYARKAKIIDSLFGKKVICVELQAEPWCPNLLYDCPIEEQQKTMDYEQFKKNINFAEKTGFDEFYLWGAEWWFWMKEKQNDPRIWDEARKLFINLDD